MKFRYDKTNAENVEDFYQAFENGYIFQRISTYIDVLNQLHSYISKKIKFT